MIGVDVTYRIHETAVQDGTAIRSQADDDPNHFDARYFGAGRRYHQPDPIAIAKMRKAFAVAADAARERKISVINAGIGGQLELFPRVDFRSLFGANRGEQWERDALRSSASAVGLSIPDAAFTATPVSEPAAGLSSAGLFALMPQDTLRWAPKLTNTHIPFGPLHDGRSIFVPRMSAAQSTVRSAASVR
jgi:hypothetical protein